MKMEYMNRLGVLAVLLLACFSMTVQAQVPGDSITTVADCGTSGMYLATLCPDQDVAIDKDSAEVFSIYTDDGKPNLLKMRLRDGKYVIKAGDHAVIKTIGEMTIPLEETNKKSSVFVDDVICLSEDKSVEDFLKSHSVGDDEYVYLLTNLERNGGFGFTHFTGNIMRKGYFFIVSTVGPEATGIRAATREGSYDRLSAGKAIYDQKGQQVVSPRAGQIYIQSGRKYLKAPGGDSERIYVQRQNTRAAEDIEDGDPVPFLPGEAGNDDGFITVATPAGPSFVRGDANGDGEVDTNDVEAISNHIVGKPTASFFMEAADVNDDDVINVADIVGIVNIIIAKTE